MKNASSFPLLTASFFIGVFLLLPFNVLAATVQYTNTPVDASNVYTAVNNNGYVGNTPQVGPYQGQLTPSSPMLLSGIKFFAMAKSSDTSMRMRLRNNTSGTFLDCQTEWFEPTERLPTWGGGTMYPLDMQAGGAPLTLTFEGTQCSVSDTDNKYIYGEREDNPGVQEYSQLYTARSVWSRDYTLYEISDTPFPPDDTRTRIIAIDPTDGQVIATSSLPYYFNTSGFVNEDDFKEGARLRIKVDRKTDQQAVGALAGFESAFGNYTYLSIPSDGSFELGTTSINNTFGVDRVGRYDMVQDIQIPGIAVDFYFFEWNITYKSYGLTQSYFTVGTTTALDNIQLSQEELLTNLYNGLGDPLAACQFSFFDSVMDFSLGGQLITCLGGLAQWAFVPNMAFVNSQLALLQANFLNRFPWGYFTRFVDIMTPGAADAVMPPIIEYTFGTASDPDVQGLTVEIDAWSPMDDVLPYAVADDGSEKNIWDIVNPYFSIVVGFCVILVALADLVGIQLAHDKTQYSSTNNGNSLTRREKRTIEASYKKPQDIGESRRALIARNGARHDMRKGRGVIH